MVGKLREVVHEWYSTPRLRDRCAASLLIVLADRSLKNGAPPFGDIHEASRPVSHDQPRVDGQHLAQYASQFTA